MNNFNLKNKKMPYALDPNYFQSSREKIMSRIDALPLDEISTDTDLLSNDANLPLPDNYFQTLHDQVLAKLSQPTSKSQDLINNKSLETPPHYFEQTTIPKKTSTILLYSPWRIASNIAATFLVLISIAFLYLKPSTPVDSQRYALESISSDEWSQYLANEGEVEYDNNDPIVNLEYISENEVQKFLQEEEQYLDLL